jgi:N-acetylglucosamine kinase-like BadF-type ATPase
VTPPNSSPNVYRIGVDGGGTKTELILVDARGEIVARHLALGCNPNTVGPARAREILTEALTALLTESKIEIPKSKITSVLLCMAGSPEFWRETAAALNGRASTPAPISLFTLLPSLFDTVTATDDSLPVLELATGGQPGLVLHGGTGSFVAACDPSGKIHYAGGLGWRFGDEGGGHEIGRRAIARALLELQGWLPGGSLARLVQTHSGETDARAITRWFYQHPEPQRQIAALAPAVLDLAAQGDEHAGLIVGEACLPLLTLAERVAARLFPVGALTALPAGLSGPVLNHPAVLGLFRTRALFPLASISQPPIEGVRRLLLRL